MKNLTSALIAEEKELCLIEIMLYFIEKSWNSDWIEILAKQEVRSIIAQKAYTWFLSMAQQNLQNNPNSDLGPIIFAMIHLHGMYKKYCFPEFQNFLTRFFLVF